MSFIGRGPSSRLAARPWRSGRFTEVGDNDTGVSYWRLLTQDARGMPLAEAVGPLQRVSRGCASHPDHAAWICSGSCVRAS